MDSGVSYSGERHCYKCALPIPFAGAPDEATSGQVYGEADRASFRN